MNLFRAEDIRNPDGSQYLIRRVLLLLKNRAAVYLHHFVGTDKEDAMHDHPKWFLSIGLRGRYVEETPTGLRLWTAPWIRWFPASHRHRLIVPPGESCLTLVVTGPGEGSDWGFYPDGVYVPWQEFEQMTGRGEVSAGVEQGG